MKTFHIEIKYNQPITQLVNFNQMPDFSTDDPASTPGTISLPPQPDREPGTHPAKTSPLSSLSELLACCTKVHLIGDLEYSPVGQVLPGYRWDSKLCLKDIPQGLIDEIDNW